MCTHTAVMSSMVSRATRHHAKISLLHIVACMFVHVGVVTSRVDVIVGISEVVDTTTVLTVAMGVCTDVANSAFFDDEDDDDMGVCTDLANSAFFDDENPFCEDVLEGCT